MKKRLLFACKGNICRSPLAEGIVRAKAEDAGLDLTLASAGTGGWHVGNPPDARAIVAARLQGYSIENQIARRVAPTDFVNNDMIIAMDEITRVEIEDMRPEGANVPVVLMSSFAADVVRADVPDPYYTGKFVPVIAQLETCADALVAQLLMERQ